MTEYSTEHIIQGCIDNSRKHQEVLYRKYFPKMIAMCYRYTSEQDRAITIVNDGFLKVFQKIDTYAGNGSFEGWIRRIVFHCLSDHFRKENSYLKFLIFEDHDQAVKESGTDALYYEDLLKIVNTLPTKTQKVFKLFAIEGYSHKEIGEQLHISDGTSKWHLSEARKILKKRLKTYDKNVMENHGG